MTRFWAGRALLPDGVGSGVVFDAGDDGRLASVRTGVDQPPPGVTALGGVVLPGLVDAHSHAFHRALRGYAAGGDFWAWRAGMYALVDRLDPDALGGTGRRRVR